MAYLHDQWPCVPEMSVFVPTQNSEHTDEMCASSSTKSTAVEALQTSVRRNNAYVNGRSFANLVEQEQLYATVAHKVLAKDTCFVFVGRSLGFFPRGDLREPIQ